MTPVKGNPRNWQEAENEETILLIDFESALQAREVHIGAKYTTAQELAEQANKDKIQLTEDKISKQYQKYVKVFAKDSFDALPKRKPWNHAIKLKPGSKAVDCKIYLLSKSE
jgi:hypothetical protein